MAFSSGKSEDLIRDSWVELSDDLNDKMAVEFSSLDPTVTHMGSMEKLLMDAQRESATPSRPNSNESSHRGSPKSLATPNNEWSNEEWQQCQDLGTDWIWDWSSRPEARQSFDRLSERFRHPGSKPGRTALSVRNTQIMKQTQLFSWANLPTLLITHACTFFLGAAAVVIYIKKYCNFTDIAQVTLD